jgi:hypothetical protein
VRCGPRPETAALFVLVLLGAAAGAAGAEEKVLLQGLADGEAWKTDAGGGAFALRDGQTSSMGRLRLWMAVQIAPHLQGFALGEGEGGSAAAEDERGADVEQFYLRYTASSPRRLVVQAGKLTLPYGSFSHRYFSSQNPLVGSPLNYEVTYPYGAQVNGALGRVDYMLAAVDKPLTRLEDQPEPEPSLRPALALGVTPLVGFRLGTYFSEGTYLSRDATALLPAGKSWNDFDEQVLGFEVQFARGHFELNAEHTRTRLEVPGAARAAGWTAYLEPRYAWSPRWFTALRLERGHLLEVDPVAGSAWTAGTERIYDLEAGAGFRIGPQFIVKASYRTDLADGDPAPAVGAGHALAIQISYGFDADAWRRPAR